MKADLFGTDWRALFLINLPVGVFALVLGARVLPEGAPVHAGLRLDGVGTVLLGAASFLLVFPLVDGRTQGWPTWMFGLLAASVPMLAAFVVHQRARLRAGRAPLVEFSVLRKRSYVSGVVFTLVFFGSIVGFSLTIGPVPADRARASTAMHASLYLAAMAVGAFFGSGVGAWAATAVGRPILHVGLTIMAAGTAVLWLSLRSADGEVGLHGPGSGTVRLRARHGDDLRPAVQHHHGRDRRPRGRLGERAARVAAAARRVAGRRRARHAVLRPDRARGRRTGGRDDGGRHLVAAEDTLLMVIGLIAVAWVIGWLLPRKAREMV